MTLSLKNVLSLAPFSLLPFTNYSQESNIHCICLYRIRAMEYIQKLFNQRLKESLFPDDLNITY